MFLQVRAAALGFKSATLCLAVLLGSALPAAAQYTAIDLTPPASDASILVGQDAWSEGNANALGVQVGAGVTAIDSTSVFRQAAMWSSTQAS